MRVFVTGGTGFVGTHVVKRLLREGHEPVLLVRSASSLDALGPPADDVIPAYGTIGDRDSVREGMKGAGAVLHLVGIIRETGGATFEKIHYEGAVNVMESAKALGIGRFIHMSSAGTREGAPSRYHRTKFKAEEHLKRSGLVYTIFRPSVIFGPEDENFNALADMILKAPAVPVIGNGASTWQPVSVKNIAELFVAALGNRRSEGKTYEVKGPEAFTFNEVIDLLMKILDVRKPKVSLPLWSVKATLAMVNKVFSLPITEEQLAMLLDPHEAPPSNFLEDFPLALIPLEKGLREYIGRK